jgi:adenosylcobinamide-GDP ribazoletransferase
VSTRAAAPDALRLAVGTLTILRVPAPRRVDPRTGGVAMALAPAVGLLLGAGAAGVGALADAVGLAPFLCAAIAVATVAVLTRGLHLDGLADTADGLGSGRRGADALAVMSRSDIGPFGVVTLLLVLLLQIGALAQLWATGHGPAAVVIAVLVSRAALPLLCRRGARGAKATGLGAGVAGSVGAALLAAALIATVLVAITVGAATDGAHGSLAALVACLVGLAAAAWFALRCAHRFGGTTGDTLGAGVETASTVALLVLAATLA